MQKPFTSALILIAAGTIFLGYAVARQTPSSSAPQTPAPSGTQSPSSAAPQTPATKPAPKSTTTKPGTTTAKAATPFVLKTPKDKASYAYGLGLGQNMRKNSVDLDTSIIYRGMKDGVAGAKTLMTDDEAKAAISEFQVELRQKQEEKVQAFLSANKAKEGVVTLPSGLQYKILTEGTGPKPTATDSVVCNYRGTLMDSTEFDSSYKRGQPATFPVNRVIPGWTEALQLMPVGSKWQLVIPPNLGYGPRGGPQGSGIGPNVPLVFEVELLSIQPKPEPAPQPAPSTNPAQNPIPNLNPAPNANPNANPAQNPPPKPNPTPPPAPSPTPTPTAHP
jgi:FKBP-type peptidyl-prolyl cis-trans isomerase FklB